MLRHPVVPLQAALSVLLWLPATRALIHELLMKVQGCPWLQHHVAAREAILAAATWLLTCPGTKISTVWQYTRERGLRRIHMVQG